jgi:CheY-like chemotaxis protein
VDAELALGRHGAVVAGLEQHVAAHPLRERARAQLVLALYRSDRQADALGAYATGRRILRDELGLEPGAPLRALHRAVLAQDPGLAWSPPAPAIPPPSDERDEPGRVLVVDDSGLNRRLLMTALTGLGHEVHAATNGRRALELLRADDPGFDVVLLDVVMPVLDGYSTLRAIKNDPRLDHLPVIMVSAVHELDSVVRCIELGATDYLPRPFSAAVLRARLRSSLAAKRLRDTEREHLRHVEEVAAGQAALRLEQMGREVAARESALRAEIDALRAEIGRVRR